MLLLAYLRKRHNRLAHQGVFDCAFNQQDMTIHARFRNCSY